LSLRVVAVVAHKKAAVAALVVLGLLQALQ